MQVSGELLILDIDDVLEELQLIGFLETTLLSTDLVADLLFCVVPLPLQIAIAVLVFR